jgi:hypothetical protein
MKLLHCDEISELGVAARKHEISELGFAARKHSR